MRGLTLLAIDTSTESCSVALKHQHAVVERFDVAPRQQAKLILSFVDELLVNTGLSLNQLDGIAFTAGPGSFTGLRIAASVVQGLAYAADLPVVSVSTLATIAQGVTHQFMTKPILVALDARMQQIYFGGYHALQHCTVSTIIDDCVIHPEDAELPSFQQTWVGVGAGWSIYEDRFPGVLLEHVEQYEEVVYPHAKDILELAEPKFRSGETISAQEAVPIYLRESVTG